MLALGVFQALLDGIGWVLARIYDVVGNYGVSIIVVTLLIKIILLPLGIKQIKSMGAMQAIQPKLKEIQKKYKGNRQKSQEETMKLYKEAGVNPLGGCLPLLLQFPILIAMYGVLRAPVPNANFDASEPPSATNEAFLNNHLPLDSQLYEDVTSHQHMNFLWMNLQCSAAQAGKTVTVPNSAGEESDQRLDCGSSTADKVPYFVILAVMIGTTFYQQRQMQKASPPNAANAQQQALLKIMPIMFGVFGFGFPSGLVVYWTTSNIWQIGQQYALLRAGHIGPQAMERLIAEQKARASSETPAKQGFFARMMDQAREAQGKQPGDRSTRGRTSGTGQKGAGASGSGKPGSTGGSGSGRGGQSRGRRPNTGQVKRRRPNDPKKPGGGGSADGEASS
jgi:YidC/Oxa1 family membrane protein insertase